MTTKKTYCIARIMINSATLGYFFRLNIHIIFGLTTQAVNIYTGPSWIYRMELNGKFYWPEKGLKQDQTQFSNCALFHEHTNMHFLKLHSL